MFISEKYNDIKDHKGGLGCAKLIIWHALKNSTMHDIIKAILCHFYLMFPFLGVNGGKEKFDQSNFWLSDWLFLQSDLASF